MRKTTLFIFTSILLLLTACSSPTNPISTERQKDNLRAEAQQRELGGDMPPIPKTNSNSIATNNSITLTKDPKLTKDFVEYINRVRTQGAPCSEPVVPLKHSEPLTKAAFFHAKDMGVNQFLGHRGSGEMTDMARDENGTGSIFYRRILQAGYPAKAYNLVGENVTFTKFSQLKSKNINVHFKKAMEQFLKDKLHCMTLMNSKFRDVGLGYYKTDKGYYWVMTFGETEKVERDKE